MFFIVSVATHGPLSPSTYTASNAPSSWMSIVRSTSSCGSIFLRSFTSRTRDLPYRFQASTLRPTIRRVAEGAQEQRHVVVLVGVAHVEGDLRLGKKRRRDALVAMVGAGVECQAIGARRQIAI